SDVCSSDLGSPRPRGRRSGCTTRARIWTSWGRGCGGRRSYSYNVAAGRALPGAASGSQQAAAELRAAGGGEPLGGGIQPAMRGSADVAAGSRRGAGARGQIPGLGVRDLDRGGGAADGGREGEDAGRGRGVVRAVSSTGDGQGEGGCELGEIGGVCRGERISGAGEMRQPRLAYAAPSPGRTGQGRRAGLDRVGEQEPPWTISYSARPNTKSGLRSSWRSRPRPPC